MPEVKKSSAFKIIAIVLMVLISVGIGSVISRSQNRMADSDFFTFWLGARLQGQGADVYDPVVWETGHANYGSTWLENPRYVYPLPLAVLTQPIGWIPLQTSAAIWIALSILSLIGTLFLIIRQTGIRLSTFSGLLLVIGIITFRPMVEGVRNGQIILFFLFAQTLAVWLLEQKRDVAAGTLLALLILKPTLGIPICGLLVIWMLRNRRWYAFESFLLTCIILWLIGQLAHPGWMNIFLAQGMEKGLSVLGYSPTLWGLANLACSFQSACFTTVSIIAIGSAIIIACVAGWWMAQKTNLISYASFAVIAALLVTPYLWAYDQSLLLLPILYLTMYLMDGKKNPLFGIFPLIFSLFSAVLVSAAIQLKHDIFSVFLTLAAGLFWWILMNRTIWIRKTPIN